MLTESEIILLSDASPSPSLSLSIAFLFPSSLCVYATVNLHSIYLLSRKENAPIRKPFSLNRVDLSPSLKT